MTGLLYWPCPRLFRNVTAQEGWGSQLPRCYQAIMQSNAGLCARLEETGNVVDQHQRDTRGSHRDAANAKVQRTGFDQDEQTNPFFTTHSQGNARGLC